MATEPLSKAARNYWLDFQSPQGLEKLADLLNEAIDQHFQECPECEMVGFTPGSYKLCGAGLALRDAKTSLGQAAQLLRERPDW